MYESLVSPAWWRDHIFGRASRLHEHSLIGLRGDRFSYLDLEGWWVCSWAMYCAQSLYERLDSHLCSKETGATLAALPPIKCTDSGLHTVSILPRRSPLRWSLFQGFIEVVVSEATRLSNQFNTSIVSYCLLYIQSDKHYTPAQVRPVSLKIHMRMRDLERDFREWMKLTYLFPLLKPFLATHNNTLSNYYRILTTVKDSKQWR